VDIFRTVHEPDPDFVERPTPESFAEERRWMVDRQLRRRGIDDTRVLDAMLRVPRDKFVPANVIPAAYDDAAQPIGHEQTISQPYTVAFMCQAAKLKGNERVLEVGTGSGYGAAVLSEIASHVFTIERIPALAEQAKQRLERLGYENVTVVLGDGTLGLPDEAPFDAIVVTAAGRELPGPYKDQLVDGGRIVIPIGGLYCGQVMYCFTRCGEDWITEDLGGFAFVPLIGQYSRPEDDI
jgi:protein-L-isoaspartate(D-aspartate) O-methyltransferase